jgi:hypothetical protein
MKGAHPIKMYLCDTTEGIRGYFGGLGTTLMASPIWAAVYFGSYETLKATVCVSRLVLSNNAPEGYFLFMFYSCS